MPIFESSDFGISDHNDTSKQLIFNVSGITAGNRRTMTVPDGDGTISRINVAETITAAWTFQTAPNLDGDGGAAAPFARLVDTGSGNFAISFLPDPSGITANRDLVAPDKSGTIVLNTNKLSALAATTSAELAGVISDETGSGALVFGTSPTITTPTIASFTNATHTHQNAAGGGTLDAAAVASGTIDTARLPITALNLTAQGAAIGSTNLITAPAAGLYLISWVLEATTTDGSGGSVSATFGWTDDAAATTQGTGARAFASLGRVSGNTAAYIASGDLTYLTTISGSIGSGKYALRVRVTKLG